MDDVGRFGGMTPDGWSRVHLSEVADQRTEKAFPVGTDERPYIALEHLGQGDPILLGWSTAGSAGSAKTVFRDGDVLFGKLRPYLRKAAPAPFDGVCSTDILPLFTRDNLDARYLAQLAQWRPLQQYAVATSSGTKMPRTSWALLGGFEFSLPPLPEQRKIAAILSSVDDAIEKTQAVIDQVQVVKRGLMQELLTRRLPGRHTRFKQTEIGKIPWEWQLRRLVDTCKNKGQYGANVPKSKFEPGGIRYIRITDIKDDGTLRDEAVGISERDAAGYLLRPGDLLFARSGATVGKTYLCRESAVRSAFAGYLVRFTIDPTVLLPAFVREYVDTGRYWRWVADRRRVQAQPNINAAEYGQLPIPCPPLNEQRRVVEIAESFNSSLRRLREEVRAMQVVKQAFMSVLLTGALRVASAPQAE